MKVTHVSLYDRFGGACIAAYRQHKALQGAGVDSRMMVRYKITDDPSVKLFIPKIEIGERAIRVARRYRLKTNKKKIKQNGYFFDSNAEYGKECDEFIVSGSPDIINFQFAWGFANYSTLFSRISPSFPIVITMHEMSHFTGGCAHAGPCDRFRDNCGLCPIIKIPKPRDLSRCGWTVKKSIYNKRDTYKTRFVAVSNWLATKARESSLLSGHSVSVIHNGVDTSVFRPLDKEASKRILGIPREVPVISFAAASVEDKMKGMDQLVDAVLQMPIRPFVLSWGRGIPSGLQRVPHRHLGSIDDEHLLALAYNSSDIFVMSSLQESFGQTALESIACGTPVVAFASGGVVEIVRHEKTGLLCKTGDIDALSYSIQKLLNEGELREHCSGNGPSVARNEFSMEMNAKKYMDLYHSLIDA
jgi:glycosyltransferase involved in cell wall biosynthesis